MPSAYFALLGVTVLWGFTFPLVQDSLTFASPLVFLFLRFTLAALLFPLLLGRRVLPKTRHDFFKGAALGLFLWGGYLFQTMGLEQTTSVRAGFITALYVPFTPLCAWILFRARIRKRMWLAVLLAFLGILIMSLPEGFQWRNGEFDISGFNFGDRLVLLCAICYALHIVFINRWANSENELPLTWVQLGVTGLLSLATLPLEGPRFEYSHFLLFSVGFTGIFGSVLAIWAMVRFQPRIPVTAAAIIYSLEPIMAGLAAWILQDHIPPALTAAGAVFILTAMLLASTIQDREIPQT